MKAFNIGGAMPFGGCNWRILDIRNNAALIITEDIAELRAYQLRGRHAFIIWRMAFYSTWLACWPPNYECRAFRPIEELIQWGLSEQAHTPPLYQFLCMAEL